MYKSSQPTTPLSEIYRNSLKYDYRIKTIMSKYQMLGITVMLFSLFLFIFIVIYFIIYKDPKLYFFIYSTIVFIFISHCFYKVLGYYFENKKDLYKIEQQLILDSWDI